MNPTEQVAGAMMPAPDPWMNTPQGMAQMQALPRGGSLADAVQAYRNARSQWMAHDTAGPSRTFMAQRDAQKQASIEEVIRKQAEQTLTQYLGRAEQGASIVGDE